MILGLSRMPVAACFEELDVALQALTARTVCLNAHAFPDDIPDGAAVYNLENVPRQVAPSSFPDREVWDFSARNCAAWRAAGRSVAHVPIGYHTSMTRFTMRPLAERDIDVVFTGCVNERRAQVLDALADRGLVVVVIPPGTYGVKRDGYLARAKVALNMLFYEDGLYPSLRAAHLVANGVPMLSEWAPEAPPWCGPVVHHRDIVSAVCAGVADAMSAECRAAECLRALQACPLAVPS